MLNRFSALTVCLALTGTLFSPTVFSGAANSRLVNSSERLLAQGMSSPGSMAPRSRTRPIKFAPGAVSAIIKDSVLRGTRDIYLVGAQKGQVMTVKIASVEKNAVFDILAPANKTGQRITLKQEATSWVGKLPQSGEYQIVVGGTRGNAKYSLTVSIQ